MQIVNSSFNCENVRLVTDDSSDVISLKEALSKANAVGEDLVCMSETSTPPVCRIMDYQKYLYNMKKNKKTQKRPSLKEIRLGCNIAQHDIDTKISQAIKFLEDGNIVKISVIYKGRQSMFIDNGIKILDPIVKTLSPYGKLTKKPKIEGFTYSVTMDGSCN